MRGAAFRIAAGLAALLLPLVGCSAKKQPPMVFAAASFQDAVGAVGLRNLVVMHAASSTLARQLLAGAEAEVFISAHPEWLQALQQADLLVPGTRQALASNELVLVYPKGRRPRLEGFQGKFAIGDPSHVPAGRYGKQALEALGLWGALRERVVTTADVRQALRLVALEEVDLGLVYATDARAAEGVEVLRRLEGEGVPQVVYEIGLLRGGSPATLRQFLEPAARQAYRRLGFGDPPR